MDSLKQVISKFEYENVKREFSKKLADLYRSLRKKERIVFRHIGFRNMARDGFCYEFYKNIALNCGVHRNTVPKYVKFFIENKLLERKVLKAQYRYRKGLVLTKLGYCFYIFLDRFNEYLSSKFKENPNYREEDFSLLVYNFILNIFYLFNNILGTMHNEEHKVKTLSSLNTLKGGAGLCSAGEMINNIPFKVIKKPIDSLSGEELWKKKRETFLKLLKNGWKLPENIMDEYDLWKEKI